MLSPDGLLLGPLTLTWGNASLLLGVLTWLWLARFAHAERAALVALVVARVWAAWPGLSLARPLGENLLDLIDIRRGAWAWIPGLLAGAAYLYWTHHSRAQGQAAVSSPNLGQMLRPLTLSVVAGLLPQFLNPTKSSGVYVPVQQLPAVSATASSAGQRLPSAQVINFWASWCGPCRSELPMLARAMQQGQPVTLVNVGEKGPVVQSFLKAQELTLTTLLDTGTLASSLNIRAYPTTVVTNAQGEIILRHLGPLSAAQLQSFVRLVKQTNQGTP